MPIIVRHGKEINLSAERFSKLLVDLYPLSYLDTINTYSRETMLKYISPQNLDAAAEIDLILEPKPHFYRFSPWLEGYQRYIEQEQIKRKEERLLELERLHTSCTRISEFTDLELPNFDQMPILPDLIAYQLILAARGLAELPTSI